MQDLDTAQKRALVAKKIQVLRSETQNKAQSFLGERYEIRARPLSVTHFRLLRHLGDFTPPAVEAPSVLHRSTACWVSNPGVDSTYREAGDFHGY